MKISINLLPEKLRSTEKTKARLSTAKKASVGLLVLMITLTAALFTWALIESDNTKSANQELEQVKEEVETYKDRESLAAVLKARLNSINTISQTNSPQSTSFNLMTKIIPAEIKVKSLNVDNSNHVIASIETQSTKSLDIFFNSLTDPKVHDGKISGTKIDNLSRSQTGQYRSDLNIVFK